MKKIYDKKIVEMYLKRYSIQNYFSDSYDFFVSEYEKNEIIVHPIEKTKYLEFIVKGRVGIYSISESGQQKYVAESHGFTFLGDMEYALNKEPMFFAECRTKVLSLCLPLKENRNRLDQDTKFLQFVLHSLAKKVNSFSSQDIFLNTVEEKILDYSKNNEIKNIGLLANNLHCSRRQLQRTLSKLCKDGILRKKQKGVYCLIGGRFDV